MSILGLTGEAAGIRRIGRIYKGSPKDEKGRWGKDLDYFRIEYDDPANPLTQKYRDAINAVYPPQPKILRCMVSSDVLTESWDNGTEAHLTVLIHRCNRNPNRPDLPGIVEYAIDPNTGAKLVVNGRSVSTGEPVQCVGEPVAWYTNSNGVKQPVICKPIGRLKLVILGYENKALALPRIGYFRLGTQSINDIALIDARMNWLSEVAMRFNGNHLVGIPFLVSREDREIGTPESDKSSKRVKRTKSLIQIEPDPVWVAQRMSDRYLTMPDFKAPKLIDEPNGDDGPDLESLEQFNGDAPASQVVIEQRPEVITDTIDWQAKYKALNLPTSKYKAALQHCGGDFETAYEFVTRKI